jgi:hypothetical protein
MGRIGRRPLKRPPPHAMGDRLRQLTFPSLTMTMSLSEQDLYTRGFQGGIHKKDDESPLSSIQIPQQLHHPPIGSGGERGVVKRLTIFSWMPPFSWWKPRARRESRRAWSLEASQRWAPGYILLVNMYVSSSMN